MITSRTAFIGQFVLGATIGAPISVDVNGRIISGIVAGVAFATADTTTPSTTDVLMDSMTTGNLPAGQYLVLFSTSLDHSNQAVATECSIYQGATQIAYSERRAMCRTNAVGAQTLANPVATFALVTLNGSEAAQGRWRTTAGTATAHERSMIWIRIS